MKRLSFLTLLLFVLILVGCGKHQPTTILPIVEVDNSEFDLSNVPICPTEFKWQLSNQTILNMDNLVKNCTEKKDKGRLLDGLGGIGTIYKIYSGQVIWSAPGGDSLPAKDTFCVDKYGNQRVTTNGLTEIGINKDLLDKIINKKLIDEIRGDTYMYDYYYCDDTSTGTDCSDMLDNGGWSDENNYFVAGFRKGDLVYVINDTLYHPGETKTSQDYQLIYQSKRNFVGIKDDKIIVRRIKDSIAIGDISTEEAYDLGTNFTLETCEIEL